MTLWYFATGYLIIGFVYLLGILVAQFTESLARPPIHGHLDVRFDIGRVGKWILSSSLLVSPFVIAFWVEWPIFRSQSTERLIWMLSIYGVIALTWVLRSKARTHRTTKISVFCALLVCIVGLGVWHFFSSWDYRLKTKLVLRGDSNVLLSTEKMKAGKIHFSAVIPNKTTQSLDLFVNSHFSPPKSFSWSSTGSELNLKSDRNGHLTLVNAEQIDEPMIVDWDERDSGVILETILKTNTKRDGGLEVTVMCSLKTKDGKALDTTSNVMNIRTAILPDFNALDRVP